MQHIASQRNDNQYDYPLPLETTQCPLSQNQNHPFKDLATQQEIAIPHAKESFHVINGPTKLKHTFQLF